MTVNVLQLHKVVECGPQSENQQDIKNDAAQIMQKQQGQKAKWKDQNGNGVILEHAFDLAKPAGGTYNAGCGLLLLGLG